MYVGALTEGVYYILISLLEPRHGYGIIQHVDELSHGRVTLAAGTLYGALGSMQEKDWIKALPKEKDSRKKEYLITPTGQAVLDGEIKRLEELLANGHKALEVAK